MHQSDYRPRWARTDDLKCQIEALTERIRAGRIVARALIDGEAAQVELARLMLKVCKFCGAAAIEQVRGRLERGDPGWIRSEARMACSTCDNATGWHDHASANHKSLWNQSHGAAATAPSAPARRVEVFMTPKLQALAGKLRDVTAKVEGRADSLIQRLDKADAVSANNADRVHAELDKIEAAVRQVEDLTNQMTNGGPPLDGSTDSSQA